MKIVYDVSVEIEIAPFDENAGFYRVYDDKEEAYSVFKSLCTFCTADNVRITLKSNLLEENGTTVIPGKEELLESFRMLDEYEQIPEPREF